MRRIASRAAVLLLGTILLFAACAGLAPSPATAAAPISELEPPR